MVIHFLIYWLVCLFLLGYSIKKYVTTKNINYLYISIIQLTFIITQVICNTFEIKLNAFMQILIFIFNFVVPCIIFGADFSGNDVDELLELKLANQNVKKGKYFKAIEHYKKALAINPNNASTYAKIGRAYKLNGDRRTAFDRFAKAIELNRDDYRSYYEIGSIFYDMGKYGDAQTILDNSLRIKPDYTPSSELLAKVLMSQEKYEEAVQVYRNAIRHDSENYELYYNLGIVNSELKNFEDAELCYKKSIEINPTMYLAYFGLGQNYLVNNDLDKAESMFKKSLPGSETMAKAYFQMAKINMIRGNEIKATNNLGSCIEVDSSYKDKALEEPLFAGIREYIIGIATASRYASKQATIEFSNSKNNTKSKKVTKKAFNIEEDDNVSEKVEEQIEMPNISTSIEYESSEYKEKEPLAEEAPAESTDEFNNYRFSFDDKYSNKTQDFNFDISENFDEKKYVEEEPARDNDIKEETNEETEDEISEDKPKKEHKAWTFFKNVLGFYSDDDYEYDEESEEDDDRDSSTNGAIRIIDEEPIAKEKDSDYKDDDYKEDDYLNHKTETLKIVDEDVDSFNNKNTTKYELDNTNYLANDTFKFADEDDSKTVYRKFVSEPTIKKEDDYSSIRIVDDYQKDEEFETVNEEHADVEQEKENYINKEFKIDTSIDYDSLQKQEDEMNIYEKFVKLKAEEDKKAVKLKEEQKIIDKKEKEEYNKKSKGLFRKNSYKQEENEEEIEISDDDTGFNFLNKYNR